MVSLLEYLELAKEHKGTNSFLGFGAVVKVVCDRYDIRVDYDFHEINVHADSETLAKIEF